MTNYEIFKEVVKEKFMDYMPIYINDMYKKYQDCGDLEVSHH